MSTDGKRGGPVAEFCAELRRLQEASGLDRTGLARRLGYSRSQLYEILDGRITRPPDFDRMVRPLVDACTGGDARAVESWRRRHGVLVRVYDELRRVDQAGRPRQRTAPALLPADVPGFAGRAGQLAWLGSLLPANGDGPAAVKIAVVSGTAGIGKTALALHWAHRVVDRFPDGQLYVNLRGFDPGGVAVGPAEAIRGFLDVLGVPPERIPAGLDALAGLYRSVLAGKKVLLVLDNARSADQVRPLLPGGAAAMVVVTSRNQLTSLITVDGARPLILDLLPVPEAGALLANRVGDRRLAAEPEAVEEIIALCARVPLALAIVAARAATHPTFPLHALADELRAARGGLDALVGGDAATDVRAVFSWSYNTLSAEAARLFQLLGLHPGPDVATAAAASLAHRPVDRIRPVLAELARAHLVSEHVPGRFAFHDLLRAYANELAHVHNSDVERRAAVHRMVDHYLHTAHVAAHLLDPYLDRFDLTPPQDGVTPEVFRDRRHAQAWLAAEHRVLLGTVGLAAEHGFDTEVWQLAWALEAFLDRCGHWHDLAAVQQAAVVAARRLDERRARAETHRGLGRACVRLGRLDEADAHFQQAQELYDALGDRVGLARARINLAVVRERQGRCPDALDLAHQALVLFQAAGDQYGHAHALNGVGWLNAQIGRHAEALPYCEQALTLHQQLGNRHGEADAWDSLGYIHHHLGDHQRAAASFRQSLGLYRELEDRYFQAIALAHLGDACHAAEKVPAAVDAWRQAAEIFDELGQPDAEQVRAKLRDLAPASN